MAKIPDNMIYGNGDDGHPLLRIDRYPGEKAWTNGIIASIGFANELNHDKYIKDFMAYTYEFIDASGMSVSDAMNVILSTRNGDTSGHRDRMEAARKCARISPQLRMIRPFFEDRGFKVLVDVYDYTNVWLMLLGDTLENVPCLGLFELDAASAAPIVGSIGIGSGDGYHRGINYSHGKETLEDILDFMIEEHEILDSWIDKHEPCVDVARAFVKEMNIPIYRLTDYIYVHNWQIVVFSDRIYIYRKIDSNPMELRLEDPATTPGKLEALLKGEIDV